MREYQLIMLALCLWREARGCTPDEIAAVACSIRNRVDRKYRGDSYSAVVTAPAQYSSFPWFNPKAKVPAFVIDMNCITWPKPGNAEWDKFELCVSIASKVIDRATLDPTKGATHYYDSSLDANPPAWAKDPTSVHLIDIGKFRFWSSR